MSGYLWILSDKQDTRRTIMTQVMIFAIYVVSASALGTGDRYCTSNVVCIEFQMLETVLKAWIGELAAKDDRILGSLISAELSFKGLVEPSLWLG
jgi:hypothetical protein